MSHRRFKIGQHPAYDNMFDFLKHNSVVLNPAAMRASLSVPWTADGPVEMANRLKQYEEELIPAAETSIQAAEETFEDENSLRMGAGRRALATMPLRLQKKLEAAWAWFDILNEEKDWIEKEYAKREAKQTKEIEGPLHLVPQGIGRLRGGRLSILDGQHVEPDENGQLYIQDKRSPYNGMATADYYDFIVKPWCRERDKFVKERYERASREHVAVGTVSKRRPPLPSWPDEIPKPKEKLNNGNSKKTLKRPAQAKTTTSKGH